MRRCGDRAVLPLLAGSILCADGESHDRRHRDLLPAFRASRVAARAEHAEVLVTESFQRLPRGRPTPLLPVLRRLTFAQLAEVVLGVSDERYIAELRHRVGRYVSGALLLATWSTRLRPVLGVALARRQRHLDKHLRLAVPRRRAGGDDAVSLLLAAGVDEQALLAELRALLIVGHETTATALAWGLDLLARHPDACARLRDGDRAYADAVVAEVLRLRPPVVDTVRLVARDVELGGRAVPAGTFVLAAPLLAHRDPAPHPEPWRFRSQRFLDARPPQGAYLPFGGGNRRCLILDPPFRAVAGYSTGPSGRARVMRGGPVARPSGPGAERTGRVQATPPQAVGPQPCRVAAWRARARDTARAKRWIQAQCALRLAPASRRAGGRRQVAEPLPSGHSGACPAARHRRRAWPRRAADRR